MKVEVIAHAGHGLAFQYPDIVTARILEHVESGNPADNTPKT